MAGPAPPAAPPAVDFKGEHWPAERLARMATAWAGVLAPHAASPPGVLAMVLGNHPESVALFFALSALPKPVAILPPEARAWRSSPPLPPGTPLLLSPALAPLARDAESLGLRAQVLPDPGGRRPPGPGGGFFRAPGVVAFTSGSTSVPRPVSRSAAGLLAEARAIADVNGLPPGGSVVGSVPLAFAGFYGLTHALLVATVLGGRLALLERFDHRALLAHFSARPQHYWPATPKMAEIAARCRVASAPPAPRICVASGGRVPETVAQAFWRRYGVPLRASYGMAEAGVVTTDAGPPGERRPEGVGPALPGVRLRVGDDPACPAPPGAPGRIWLSTPWQAEGYGFPPALEPVLEREGWRATGDVGILTGDGCLVLAGRADDCFKTEGGFLVNPADLARVVGGYPGIGEVAVVPVPGALGQVVGVLAEGGPAVDPDAVRRHLARVLPRWAQPRVLKTVRELPRLPGGKIDRRACIATLDAYRREGDGPC